MINIRRILVPTDFSDNAKAAVDYGCELARQFNAELHLLNVVDSHIAAYSVEMDMFGTANHAYDIVEAQKRAVRMLDELPGLAGDGCSIVRQTELGAPCPEIARYARENDIDLIAISIHGYTGLTHFLLGSTAENIVRTAPCPVLTVRPEGHQFVNQTDDCQSKQADFSHRR